MALTFATYAVPDPGWLAAAVALLAVIAAGGRQLPRRHPDRSPDPDPRRLLAGRAHPGRRLLRTSATDPLPTVWPGGTSVYGVLQAAGLLFFAFAGYARIATMGEEVRDPPAPSRAPISIALLVAVGIYLVVGVMLLWSIGAPRSLHSTPAGDRRRHRRSRVGGTDRSGRRCSGQPGCVAGVDRGDRPHRLGDGPQQRPAGLARGGSSPVPRAAPRRGRARGRGRSPGT